MKRNRLIIVALAAAVALALAGVGIAQAVGGGSEKPVTGSVAERAKAAALKAAGGTVLEVEQQDGDGAGVYEVEVKRADGSTVEIHLDADFQQVGSASDDDAGSDADDEEGEESGPGS